jgi:hypothetical protein
MQHAQLSRHMTVLLTLLIALAACGEMEPPEESRDPADTYGPPSPPALRDTIAHTVLTSGSSTMDGSSVQTASITPGANRAVFAAIQSATAMGPVTPTAKGNGLTWVQVANVAFVGGVRRLTVFRAMGASPTAGMITFTFQTPMMPPMPQTQTSFTWSVIEFDGVTRRARRRAARRLSR